MITVKTVTLCKKLFSFSLKSKKQKKDAGTNLALLSQSRNMIGHFKKNYLLRPIKICFSIRHALTVLLRANSSAMKLIG